MDKYKMYLNQDIKVAKKIENIEGYYDKLELAVQIIEKFNIQGKIVFYMYAQVLSELEGIDYHDTQAFIRFKNKEYYNLIQQSINKPKIIEIKKLSENQ